MLKRIKVLLLGNAIWLAIAVTLFIAYLSLIKTSSFPDIQISYVDKIYHLIAYFTLAVCWLLSFKNKKRLVVIACVIYGILIEVLQEITTTYRTGDVIDFLANTVGILLALFVFNNFLQNKIEKSQ